jgi:hypothetical protein
MLADEVGEVARQMVAYSISTEQPSGNRMRHIMQELPFGRVFQPFDYRLVASQSMLRLEQSEYSLKHKEQLL